VTYVDFIAARPELTVDGEPQGTPDPLPGVAATVGGTREVDGVTEYLCRVRALPEDVAGLELLTEAEFQAEHPDEWTAFGMEPYEIETEDGTIAVVPQVPVFL